MFKSCIYIGMTLAQTLNVKYCPLGLLKPAAIDAPTNIFFLWEPVAFSLYN